MSLGGGVTKAVNKTPRKKNSVMTNAHSFIWRFYFLQEPTKLSISLCIKSKRKKADEAWWCTKITAGLHTHPELPCLHGSNLFQLDMAAECVASALTHTSHAAQPVNRVMECIQIWHTHTHTRVHTHTCAQVWKRPSTMLVFTYKEHTHTLTRVSPQQTEIQTIRPTHQLFTTVRSNKNNMRRFEKSICERNLKLWNSIWSLCLCLSLSISLFSSPSSSLQRKCNIARVQWRDDRSL